ncbi:MAG: hypothetical protein VX100_07295 [Pseudomonadota bacterium]|nr:hypothetical protein [Pseudomonadota bacterium]
MAKEIQVNLQGIFTTLLIKSSLTKLQMLSAVAKDDPEGERLDRHSGNIASAFAELIAEKLRLLHMVHSNRTPADTARRFNCLYRDFPQADNGMGNDWQFKIVSICRVAPTELTA